MEQQMSLFEEGGMKDDGLKKDPVSGNDIPPGSLAKEVRDDIPAQLSDGEYVVPADVVQYYGVKFFEDLRMEAKSGLRQMEETGRIGGEPVSVTMIALGEAEKKKKKKAQGGPIYANEGVLADQKLVEGANPAFNPADYAVLGFTPVSPIYQTGSSSQNDITKSVTYYHGETGESKVVTFVNGIVTPPEDAQYTQPPWSTIKPSTTQATTQQSDDRERKDAPPGWGADPAQYNFNGWDLDRWNQEVDTLLAPIGGGNLGIIGGFFETGGIANAITAQKLMEAKGLDTSGIDAKIQAAYGKLNNVQKGVVNFLTSEKMMAGHIENVTKSNPSYANYKGSPTTPTSKNNQPEKNNQDDNEERRQRREEIEKATKESLAKVTTDDASKAAQKKGGGAAKTSTGEMIKADEQTGFESRFYKKGGLLKKPKRNPKKPRGKGLGSK